MGRILYATDFSPASRAAFAKAISLARTNKSELVIAHVLAPILPVVGDGAYVSPEVYTSMEEASRKYGQKHLNALVTRARAAGVRARGVLLEGPVHDRIVAAARKLRADMIVIGTHGRSGLARFVLGSVASRVVSHARCPVLTVRGAK
jgi:nucleotide-binding universal stress UspA family protein